MHALVRAIPDSYIFGINDFAAAEAAAHGHLPLLPDVALTRVQHEAYCDLLAQLGCQVVLLPPDEAHPDSPFVEDPVVVIGNTALMTILGAANRRGEGDALEAALTGRQKTIVPMQSPGTCDGGDVLTITDRHGKAVKAYVGLSARTNQVGFQQVQAAFVEHEGFDPADIVAIPVKPTCLHLKTATTYLGDGIQLIDPTGVDPEHFADAGLQPILVPEEEKYAANCLRIGTTISMPAGFEKTRQQIAAAFAQKGIAIEIREVAMSEFAKVDGGLTCLSVLFE